MNLITFTLVLLVISIFFSLWLTVMKHVQKRDDLK